MYYKTLPFNKAKHYLTYSFFWVILFRFFFFCASPPSDFHCSLLFFLSFCPVHSRLPVLILFYTLSIICPSSSPSISFSVLHVFLLILLFIFSFCSSPSSLHHSPIFPLVLLLYIFCYHLHLAFRNCCHLPFFVIQLIKYLGRGLQNIPQLTYNAAHLEHWGYKCVLFLSLLMLPRSESNTTWRNHDIYKLHCAYLN